MWKFIILLSLIAIYLEPASAASGSIELDEYSFDKLINKFDVSLVKFDVAFPYGDQHDAFIALAKEAKEIDELLIAEVGVKDYGEKDNEELAKKYGAKKDNFPVVKLFVKGKKDPITFDGSEFTIDELRRFVRGNTGIHFILPGCVRQLDQLVIKFMKAKKDDKKAVLENVENVQKSLHDKDKASGKYYKAVMDKIMDKGDEFVKTEYERIKKLLGTRITEEKRRELGSKLNILQTFQLSEKDAKDEL